MSPMLLWHRDRDPAPSARPKNKQGIEEIEEDRAMVRAATREVEETG
jgi:hypothetical protein